jgi:hypothetical protein
MSGITPFVMLPGSGPACEGDDCLPDLPAAEQPRDASA